jgi:catalase
LSNEQGKVTFARYRIIPEAGRHFLSKEEASKALPDYLSDEVRRRVQKGPIRFELVLQLAAPGDKIDDPSVAWSEHNQTIRIGRLEFTSSVPDSEATDRGLLFMPGVLPVGIAAADPMIQFRNKTYPVSYERRQGAQ